MDSRVAVAPLLALVALLSLAAANTPQGDADLVKNLPGLTFHPNFKQYSGYFNLTSQNRFHYWFIESQNDPINDPVVLWLNGGPGCSSLGGFFTELGPFRPNPDGKTVFENIYSWNKGANVLFLESPHNVGFSYRPPSAGRDDVYNDDKTVADNSEAVKMFFDRFPQYQGNDFYVTGESYGGVYVPTLTNKLIQMIQAKKLNAKLVGMAVGNGELNSYDQVNSAIDLNYYRGIIGKIQFESIKECCNVTTYTSPLSKCNVSAQIYFDSAGNAHPYTFSDPQLQQCAENVVTFGFSDVWSTENDVYNTYQDCYGHPSASRKKAIKMRLLKSSPITNGIPTFVDQGSQQNTFSTDAQWGFYCYQDDALAKYLNQPEVRAALHIPHDAPVWSGCNDTINDRYDQQHHDMMPIFDSISKSGYNLRVLIYNGDVDEACNFMGDQWFIERFAQDNQFMTTQNHTDWDYAGVFAGYQKKFVSGNVQLDQLTVKGAGHFVPMDRPAPALQMITNFIAQADYSKPVPYDLTPQPTLSQFQSAQPTITRKQADKINSLPGLTFPINFNQYSGYLQASAGNYLHYWLVESQANPSTDPLVLWLNGGPGCSSLGGFLTELGPFHPNPDGKTLFENVYSWNKGANVLFLEGPRNVGFSFQNFTENPDPNYDDAKTASDNFLAIMDFLSVFPEFQGRKFFVTGESYGGVYVPTLTSLLIDKIQAGQAPGLNLQGMAVGNGELSAVQQINSAISLLYYHGMYGKNEWDQLIHCCPEVKSYQELAFCDFSRYIYLDSAGNAHPRDANSPCGKIVASMGQERVWGSSAVQDVYNMYQDCYQQTATVFGSRRMNKHVAQFTANKVEVVKQNTNFNPISTDNQGGFPCFASSAAQKWVNTRDVRAALHIPDYVQDWTDCNDTINAIYTQQHNDTGAVFDHIYSSGYPLRVLIYNGDIDTACNFLGDQWFVEAFAKRHNLQTTKKYGEWDFESVIAGYWKRFSGGKVQVDLLTVKGAGHLVPTDRPGPAFQMINAFLNDVTYNTTSSLTVGRTPLKQQFQVQAQIAQSVKINSLRSRTANFIARKAGRVSEENIVTEIPSMPKMEARSYPDSKQDDLITNLPGVTFKTGFQMYSGFLNATNGTHLHYWLVESERDPANDPIVLWLNGGPGCSSLVGLLTELGPFRPSADGSELLENPYSWNKFANVFFLEAPRAVGYSYNENDPDNKLTFTDDMTADDNAAAVVNFFAKFPEYQNRPFYITGESYGGVYIPTLADRILAYVNAGNQNKINFQGVAIGNGILSEYDQLNSAVDLMYFRGVYDRENFEAVAQCCVGNDLWSATPCNFSYYDTQDKNDPFFQNCQNLVQYLGEELVDGTTNDAYNTYQDCYNGKVGTLGNNQRSAFAQRHKEIHSRRQKRDAYNYGGQVLQNKNPFVNQEALLNYQSTDAIYGFPCWGDGGAVTYMNRDDVRKALHVDRDELKNVRWHECSNTLHYNGQHKYDDMSAVFQSIFSRNQKFRMLIYNGDVDMQCQFLGDEWFIERLMKNVNAEASARTAWNYTEPGFNPRIGGYLRQFSLVGGSILLDQLTIKGSGHMVPMDRPGPALQMLNNFINKQGYSTPLPKVQPKPLLPVYTPPPVANVNRKAADQIFDLPGLTYDINFKQYSGYLKANLNGHYLHYWYVESQRNPSKDPLLLWLNGGPGCSSLMGLLTEQGPFRPNPDGKTLFENVYSWNKGYNMIFLEGPRGVGFSYQDPNVSNDTTYNDNLSAIDYYNALLDFFTVYPELLERDFYVTGESYGGVYVPTLVQHILQEQNPSFANFKGFVVGNGLMSSIQNVRSLPDYMYFHGMVGSEEWNQLAGCCKNPDGLSKADCHYDDFVTIPRFGTFIPKHNASDPNVEKCGKIIENIASKLVWDSAGNDVYNLYQDCYTPNSWPAGFSFEKLRKETHETLKRFPGAAGLRRAFYNQQSQINYLSTDNTGGFQCYSGQALWAYLHQAHVRDTLHIPDYVQPFQGCQDYINENYQYTHIDMSDVYKYIFANAPKDFKILIYTGDVDTACGMLESQWFFEELYTFYSQQNAAQVLAEHRPWHYAINDNYKPQIAGYVKSFMFNSNVHLELITVKGAGHMVPADRPGPALQMIGNFIEFDPKQKRPVNFSQYGLFDITRKPLVPPYNTTATEAPFPTQPTQTSSSPSSSSSTSTSTSSSSSSTTTTSPNVNAVTTTSPGAGSSTSTSSISGGGSSSHTTNGNGISGSTTTAPTGTTTTSPSTGTGSSTGSTVSGKAESEATTLSTTTTTKGSARVSSLPAVLLAFAVAFFLR
ncbi:hypothetical protein QR680_019175 [Steinernema hermaphroditum]|uniref:Carboxypeptidase n=1 Tax=Steinernema hermaphroditum TaxID=289476 RepID=A0AA39HK74_9BILA|nr:hypothetical protein QR680_019175 [Steinernema hermaphroditum]